MPRSHLHTLKTRLRAILADYEHEKTKRDRTDKFKRQSVGKSLRAVVDFLRAQPDYCGEDALLLKMIEALAEVERSRSVSWLSKAAFNKPPVALRILELRRRAAARVDALMLDGMSREVACRKVCRETAPGVFVGTARNWKSVARWREKPRPR